MRDKGFLTIQWGISKQDKDEGAIPIQWGVRSREEKSRED